MNGDDAATQINAGTEDIALISCIYLRYLRAAPRRGYKKATCTFMTAARPGGKTTEAAEDRCWNCGMVPKRWFDVTPSGLDEQRLLCSNCFARTTRPRIDYGWPRSRSPEWDDHDEDEKRV
jgi:hypothetical protein